MKALKTGRLRRIRVLFDNKMITLGEKHLFTFCRRLSGKIQLKPIEKVLLN